MIYLKQTLLLIVFLIIYIHSNAQTYYEITYLKLQDNEHYPKLIKALNTKKITEIKAISNNAFKDYIETDKAKALYHFNLGMYFIIGYNNPNIAIAEINKKIKYFTNKQDTINEHYAAMHYIKAFALTRIAKPYEAKQSFNIALHIYDKIKYIANLHYLNLCKSAAQNFAYTFEYDKSYKYGKLALDGFEVFINQEIPNDLKQSIKYDIAYSYLTLAALMKENRQTDLAISYNKQAYNVFEEVPYGMENCIVALNNLANNYIDIKNYKSALETIDKALFYIIINNSIQRQKLTYISILSNKGIIYSYQKKYNQADSIFKKLLNFEKNHLRNDEISKSQINTEIGYNYLRQNKLDSAEYYAQKAKKASPKYKKTYKLLSEIRAAQKKYIEAALFMELNVALIIDKHLDYIHYDTPNSNEFKNAYQGYKNLSLLANYYLQIYKQNKHEPALEKCIAYTNLADTLINKFNHSTLIGSNKTIASEYHQFTETGLDANFLYFKRVNFQAYANNILNLINNATAFKLNAEINQINTFSDKNEENQINILNKIRDVENQLLAVKPDKREKLNNQLIKLKIKAFDISYQLQNNEKNKIKQQLYHPIKYNEIANHITANEAILCYYKSKNQIYSVLLTKKDFKINKISIDHRFNKLLNNYYKCIKLSSNNLNTYAQLLYDYLLGSYKNELKNINNLVIIPDQELNMIPFEVLRNKNKYLIQDFAISYNYSLFLWLNSRKKTKASVKKFTGYAPVFNNNNNQLINSNLLSYDEQLRSNYNDIYRDNRLSPLPFSELEINESKMLFKNKSLQTMIFTNTRATEANFKKNIKETDILHIATHGYSSKKEPAQSGLFFYKSNKLDDKDATNDGFLYSGEIFNIKTNANLVVLSACKSGVGKIITGEGVMALPRSFIYAGVPNIIASLWKIHDEKTKNMMIDFYTFLLDGNSYKKALQMAKIEQIKRNELPVDWSSIILIGE